MITYAVQCFENLYKEGTGPFPDKPAEPKPYNGAAHPVYYSEHAFGPYLVAGLENAFKTQDEKAAQHVAHLLTVLWKPIKDTYWRPIPIPVPVTGNDTSH